MKLKEVVVRKDDFFFKIWDDSIRWLEKRTIVRKHRMDSRQINTVEDCHNFERRMKVGTYEREKTSNYSRPSWLSTGSFNYCEGSALCDDGKLRIMLIPGDQN